MSDTIDLLKECDAGIKMGIEAIDEVLEHVENHEFKSRLINYKKDYNKIQDDLIAMLDKYDKDGKDPNPMAKAMTWMKTNFNMAFNENDATIADLMTDGCNMGVKSINKYLNKYTTANKEAKDLTKQLIDLMDRQVVDIRKYL